MKKILSLALAVMMLVSAVPMAYAAETDDGIMTVPYDPKPANCQLCGAALEAVCPYAGTGTHSCVGTYVYCANCDVCMSEIDGNFQSGTQIVLTGGEVTSSFSISVPSTLSPGDSGTVSVSGNWASNQTLNVTCPNSVTLTYGDQSMNVGIDFAGVTLVGSDIDAVSKSANITVEDATAIFGTWTGTLTYTVELVTEEA